MIGKLIILFYLELIGSGVYYLAGQFGLAPSIGGELRHLEGRNRKSGNDKDDFHVEIL